MKKIVLSLMFLCSLLGVFAQSTEVFTAESDHYRVYSEISEEHASNTAVKLEALMKTFNSYFRFDPAGLPVKLKVQIFNTKDRYDEYLTRVIDETRDDFIYLHYSDLNKSELVGYQTEEQSFDISLTHQGFIQYIRSFIPNPPLWMREGFAVYFEKIYYDPEFQAAIYKENLTWLETLKDQSDMGSLYTVENLLGLDVGTAKSEIENFYPQSWGLVSFLLNTEDKEYNRIMWDAISALEPGNSLAENIDAVYKKAFAWFNSETLNADYASYISERKSFKGLIEDGISKYTLGDYEAAEKSFITAITLEDGNYIPYYYLGLIQYTRKSYELADYYYKTAMDLGFTSALSYYALGVNSYAYNDYDKATEYLSMAKEIDPDNYTAKADEILERITPF